MTTCIAVLITVGLFSALMTSESKGRYFCRSIRDKWRFSRRAQTTTPISPEMPRDGESLTRKGKEP